MKTNKELTEEELKKSTGGNDTGEKPTTGGFPVSYYDSCCHFEQSKFELASDVSYGGSTPTYCRCCKYNPHRTWAQSICDYPNGH